MPSLSSPRDIITVIVDPRHPLGKQINSAGEKSSHVAVSLAHAIQRQVDTPETMARLLQEVGNNPHAAIINSCFPEIPVDKDFLILSEKELQKHLGMKTRDELAGVHSVRIDDTNSLAIGRFKENVTASSWQLLDRDIDEHTPQQFAQLTTDEWLDELCTLIPGLQHAAKVIVPSSSARIRKHGKQRGNNNAHVWIQVQDADDVERMRPILLLRAIEQGKAWQKPKTARHDGTTVVGSMPVALLDHTVWTRGRLAFEGKPTVATPYSVAPHKVKVIPGGRLNTHQISPPSKSDIQRFGTTFGLQLQLRQSTGVPVLDCDNLMLDTPLELQGGEVLTVQEALPRLQSNSKLRCQTPFRESSSFAAFFSQNAAGKPFLHDSGTNTTHWLNDAESLSLGFTALYPTLESVLAQCEQMHPQQLETKFAELVLQLPSVDRKQVLHMVKERTGQTLEVLKEHLKRAESKAREAALEHQVGKRTVIPYTPGSVTKMAATAERAIAATTPVENYLSFCGNLAQVSHTPSTLTDPNGHFKAPLPKIDALDAVGIRRLIEANVVFKTGSRGDSKIIDVPMNVIDTLLANKEHAAPTVAGLLLHPSVHTDGTIWAGPGLHSASSLLYVGEQFSSLEPYRRRAAKEALLRLRQTFLQGFAFATPEDADMALASLFTGVVRRMLSQAPGFAYVAPMQSSGKTTLARMVHLILTGREMDACRFPEGKEEEMAKYLLALLQGNPVMICLDNLTDGITFHSASLAQAITAPVFNSRLLGKTQTISCPTNTLFVVTGNNIQLGADEATRWLVVHLDTKSARPHERQFQHADIIEHGLKIRPQVLRDVVGIISGFLKFGEPSPPKTRFPQWDKMVRQPLMWANASDAADAIQANIAKSPVINAGLALVLALHEYFKAQPFTAVQLAQALNTMGILPDLLQRIAGSLGDLKARDIKSSTSVGRALSSIVDRPVEHDARMFKLVRKTVNGTAHYSIDVQ